jgi:hypothetical protein
VTWRTRYEELEKMYAENQQRMTSTVTSMERSYNEKMSKIEESVKHLEDEKAKARDELKKNEEKLKLSAERPKFPITPKVLTVMSTPTYAQESSSSSDESGSENKIEAMPLEKEIQIEEIEQPKTVMETFAAQKFMIRPKKQKPSKKLPTTLLLEQQKSHQSTRDRAEEIFNQRLDVLGIAQHQQRMSKKEFNRVNSDLADIRDVNMKKNKTFFITRKKLQSKVDELFHLRHKKKDKHEVKPANPPKASKRAAATVMESPIKEAPVESPNLSTSRAFRDNLQQMLQRRLPLPSQSVKEEPTPSSSKKNVKFMDDIEVPKRAEQIREMNEDDSDFDISDFSTEVEEAKMRELLK